MSYLEEIQTQIKTRNVQKLVQLWEEYCADDKVDVAEFIQILKLIKKSDFVNIMGKHLEKGLSLWKIIEDKNSSYEVLRCLIDIQTTHSPLLADLATQAALEKYDHLPKEKLTEWMRFSGLAQKTNFQGALSSLDLLNHLVVGNFVFHTGGWGVGEIMEVSTIRQQVTVEFENVLGQKHLTFLNSLKVLEPISEEHFLVKRFSFADKLEADAMKDPVAVIKGLLYDLGPKSAGEIKEFLYDVIIPEETWNRWWQNARNKLKKDSFIETPQTLREPFRLRLEAKTAEERLKKVHGGQEDVLQSLRTAYNMMRDLNENDDRDIIKNSLFESVNRLLARNDLFPSQRLEATLLLESSFEATVEVSSEKLISECSEKELITMIDGIDIVALKKKACTLIKSLRADWPSIFITLLVTVQQGMLRDYLLKELNQGETKKLLVERLREVAEKPTLYPELLVWYFQKIISKKDSDLPFSDKDGQCLFFESFLILFNNIEYDLSAKDLLKRMYMILSGNRYAVIRDVIEGTSLEFIKEFLLLVAKCQTLSDHDHKILRSLSEVVHPSLAKKKSQKQSHLDGHILWTTQAGLLKTQEEAKRIATVDIIVNAKEIEAAREMGDLRENSEYKFALEKKARLQNDLKRLSEQLKRCREITELDVSNEEIDIGSIVVLEDQNGKDTTYTLLGPWEADPDNFVLSFQSKFAQAMFGLKEGESFTFRTDEYKVVSLRNIFDK